MRSRQDSLLSSGFLDLLGDSKTSYKTLEYPPVSLDAVTDSLVYLGGVLMEKLSDKLNEADRIATGTLEKSFTLTDVSIFGKVYSISINMASYYDFVNKGVKGWADEKGGNSPYQFKKSAPSPKMVKEIRKWVIREGLKGKGRENGGRSASLRDKKRHALTDTSTRTAYAIAMGVKKKGLRPSHFVDDAIKDMAPLIKQELGKALKVDIITNLTNAK